MSPPLEKHESEENDQHLELTQTKDVRIPFHQNMQDKGPEGYGGILLVLRTSLVRVDSHLRGEKLKRRGQLYVEGASLREALERRLMMLQM